MSEYQYYEFVALDRPLNQEQIAELRALTTRATITPTRLQNEYHWGSFRGNPSVLKEKYFDTFLYVANWGTRRFMLRLPRRLLGPEVTSLYCACEGVDVEYKGDFAILEFYSDEEGAEDFEGGEGWLSSLVPLRADLTAGDHRALYLGWLLCAQIGHLEDETLGPPVPAGLGSLMAPLEALADFLERELGNAGHHDPTYHERRVRYAREFLDQFPDEDANHYVNFMWAQGESLWGWDGRRSRRPFTRRWWSVFPKKPGDTSAGPTNTGCTRTPRRSTRRPRRS